MYFFGICFIIFSIIAYIIQIMNVYECNGKNIFMR